MDLAATPVVSEEGAPSPAASASTSLAAAPAGNPSPAEPEDESRGAEQAAEVSPVATTGNGAAAASSPASEGKVRRVDLGPSPASKKTARFDSEFVEWLQERPAMFRIGHSSGLGWEFPLSNHEKRELVMLNLAGETLAQREQIEKQTEVIEMLQERSPQLSEKNA